MLQLFYDFTNDDLVNAPRNSISTYQDKIDVVLLIAV